MGGNRTKAKKRMYRARNHNRSALIQNMDLAIANSSETFRQEEDLAEMRRVQCGSDELNNLLTNIRDLPDLVQALIMERHQNLPLHKYMLAARAINGAIVTDADKKNIQYLWEALSVEDKEMIHTYVL